MQEIIEVMAAQIVPATAVVLASLVSAAMVYAIKWLKLKTGSEAVAVAGEIVASTVNDLTSTTVKSLKEKATDGKLTIQEGAVIKTQALNRIKKQMPTAVAKASTLAIGDLDAYIKGKIEQEVEKYKINKA